jgi:SAM-dependent methyltransferase
MRQDEAFLRGEADAWFARNRAALVPESLPGRDPVLVLLARAGLRPREVVEVGAANGYRLAALCRCHPCNATAVEPSGQALADGRARFPEVHFLQGMAHHMPGLEDGRCDLVIVNFVMHWVERALLLRTAAEIDRVLQDGGYLLVGDFYPEAPQRVRYHHLPHAEVWTYKQDYPQLWLASQLYEEVGSLTFDHDTLALSVPADSARNGRVTLLRKSLAGGHRPTALPHEARTQS